MAEKKAVEKWANSLKPLAVHSKDIIASSISPLAICSLCPHMSYKLSGVTSVIWFWGVDLLGQGGQIYKI